MSIMCIVITYYIYIVLFLESFFIFSNPSVGEHLSFPSMRCSMYRERIKHRPPVPETLTSLCDMIENSDIMKNIYQGSVISNDKIAIILSTTDLLKDLSSATEIYVDGTFSVSLTVFY